MAKQPGAGGAKRGTPRAKKTTDDTAADRTAGAAAPEAGARPAGNPRDRIVDALMALAAEERWDAITLPMIAERAGVTLGELRDAFPSKGAILGGLARKIDRIVLDGTTPDMLAEPTRDRLIDVMMRRFDALAPYKEGLREIRRSISRDPLTMGALNQLALNSWRYMLAAADIDTEGDLGFVRVQGAALIFAQVLDTWLDDDDPDMARTMARLDKELGRGERVMQGIENVNRLVAPFRGFVMAAMERRGEMRDRFRDAFDRRGRDWRERDQGAGI
jgi:AcrR family transcriptional regulator